MNPNDIRLIRRYVNRFYGENIKILDCEDRNQRFDLLGWHNSFNLRIEYKNRYFETGKTDKFLEEKDILIELIQTLPYFSNRRIPTNENINLLYRAAEINTAIGWFYKCNADRLFYIKYLDKRFYEFVDIDFKNFKGWFLNNLGGFELQYCDKTTGTINIKVPYYLIPAPLITVINQKGERSHVQVSH